MRPLLIAKSGAISGLLLIAAAVRAEVVFDGTMGPAGELSGVFDIPDSFGTRIGGNLFHSFTTFNVNAGESATFTSGFAGVTNNVVGRVTGGSLSLIDGTLASTIPGAAVWLINPNGVLFGENATISVPGSLHLSTADYLLFEDGSQFNATNPGNTILTMVNPAAFGFLDADVASIGVGAATLSVAAGEALSLVGGEVSLNGSAITAPGARVNFASVAGTGELTINGGAIEAGTVTDFANVQMNAASVDSTSFSGGDVMIIGEKFVMDAGSTINASTYGIGPTDTGGNVGIEAGDVSVLNHSWIAAWTFGTGDAGDIIVQATGDIVIQGDATGFEGGIFSNTAAGATGNGGDISVSGENLSLVEGAAISSLTFGAGNSGNVDVALTGSLAMRGTPGFFDARIVASGNNFYGPVTGDIGTVTIDAGDISMEMGALIQARTFDGAGSALTVNADTLSMTGASQMSASTLGAGDGGALTLNIDDIDISGFQFVPDSGFYLSALFAQSLGAGDGGAIVINSSDFNISNFANVFVGNSSSGAGGTIEINSADIAVSDSAFVGANVFGTATGPGGRVDIDTERLVVSGAGLISTGSFGNAPSGDVNVFASDSILIDGEFLTCCDFTGIFANTFSNGDGGQIAVTTPYLEIRDGGFIQAGSFSNDFNATGAAQDITVNVDNLWIDAGFISVSTWTAGSAGTVTVNATESITLQNSSGHIFNPGNEPIGGLLAQAGSNFTSTLATGDGGRINVNANELIILDGGAIAATTQTAGAGGSIDIDVASLVANADSLPTTGIGTNTGFGTGHAGSIDISAGDMSITGLASIQAATIGFGGSGDAGSINVEADELTLADGGSITTLTASSGDAGTIDINVAGEFNASGGDQNPIVAGNVSSNTNESGNGGVIRISADSVVVDNAGILNASTSGSGRGGDLFIEGRIVSVSNDSQITASATGSGHAGDILVIAVEDLIVTNASIQTSSEISAGGNIELDVGQMMFVREGGSISAAAGGVTPTDDGGNIQISQPVFVILRGGSILATANAGNGGNIDISADSFIVDVNSVIDASSKTGLDGKITIDTVNNIHGSVLVLNVPDVDVPDLLTNRCVAAAFRNSSSLTVENRSPAAWSPEDYLPSSFGPSGGIESMSMQQPGECRLSIVLEKIAGAD